MTEQKFWEWCGFTRYDRWTTNEQGWKAPNGDKFLDAPPIDLNNLFKYAVPKLGKKTQIHLCANPVSATIFVPVDPDALHIICKQYRYDDYENKMELVTVLYKVICEVIENERARA
jgi:hypothetical protein